MRRYNTNYSLVLLSALSLTLACGDDGVSASASVGRDSAETGDGGAGDQGNDNSGMDGDGNSGDGDGNSGDGDGNSGDGDGNSGDGDGNSGDGDGNSGDGDGGADSNGDGDSGDGDADEYCGDGVINGDEECDDGLYNGPSFACLADCTLNVCGDGFVGPDEGCDDGNNVDGDGCSADCMIENPPLYAIYCGNKIYQCGDTIDNDGDGYIDVNDPECTSPCDDDEGSFKTNLPGQNNGCKSDCYFDANSGGGNDQCSKNLKCDPESPGAENGCAYDPNANMCGLQVSQTCLDTCVPVAPNGCDCFGCCEYEGQYIYLDGVECSLATLDQCSSCTFVEACSNPCVPEECELCFGQGYGELPQGCSEPGCDDGVMPCADQDDCPANFFCQTGCCVPAL